MKVNATKSWLFVTMLSTAGLCSSGPVGADDSDRNRIDDAVGKAKLMIQASKAEADNPFGRGGSSLYYWGGRPGTNVTSAIRMAAEAVLDAKDD